MMQGVNPMVIRKVRRLEELRQELRGLKVKVESKVKDEI